MIKILIDGEKNIAKSELKGTLVEVLSELSAIVTDTLHELSDRTGKDESDLKSAFIASLFITR